MTVATDGRQALAALEQVRPDLILLDVVMPVMDGYEACQHIKSSPLWQHLPVIFLTSRTDPADIVRGFELGAVDYVRKPFNAHELLARVRTHLTIDQLNRENASLLRNMLPTAIADRLKRQPGVIADRVDDVSVLFADIVGFTRLSTQLSPTEVVSLLNQLFSEFDALVEALGLEKIKTIGDAYMVAGGLPEWSDDHLQRMVRLAQGMQEVVKRVHLPPSLATGASPRAPLEVRIGIHVGGVVPGVIGLHKLSYDIWGDTVNLASRIEAAGVPGRVQVSEAVYRRIASFRPCEARGAVDIKGVGPTPVYLLAP